LESKALALGAQSFRFGLQLKKKAPRQKTWGFFYGQKKLQQISGIAKRPGLVGFLNKLVNS